jgi:hypothetical protein
MAAFHPNLPRRLSTQSWRDRCRPIADIRCSIHSATVRGRKIALVLAAAAGLAVLTIPIWGMGLAVFLDAKRTILGRLPSPDGKRIAQTERMVVGGAPSIVVIVRSWWMPNWYLSGCLAASHYQDTDARAFWKSNNLLVVQTRSAAGEWTKTAPFKGRACSEIRTAIRPIS